MPDYTSRPLHQILSGLYPMFDVDDYCRKCNHITPHTKIKLPDRTAWICKVCDEVHTNKEPED